MIAQVKTRAYNIQDKLKKELFMIAVTLAEQIIQLFIMMFCGYLLVRFGILKSSDSRPLSALLVYIITPCTILNAFQIEYTSEAASGFLLAVVSALLIHVLLFVIVYSLDRIFHFDSIEKASLIYSNAGNLIIPLVSAIHGEEWVIYASAFMIVQLFILWTHGRSLVEGRKAADFKAIVSNVNLIACVLGLIMFLLHIQLPPLLKSTVKSLGGVIGPVSMLMLGIILAGVDMKSIVKGKRIWVLSALKMILIPLAVMLVMKYCGITKMNPAGVTIIYISLMATMTPSASTVTQMAQLYGKDASMATAINTMTTLICIGTMPLLTMIYYL